MRDVTDRPTVGTATPAGAVAVEDRKDVQPLVMGHGGGGGGGRRVDRDLTQGSIPWTLFSLAWPQTIAGSIQTLDQLADLVWAGFIGPSAIASIGVAQGWNQMLMTFRMGLDVSTRAMISRAVGAKDVDLARHVAMQSMIYGIGLMLVLSTLAVIFTEFLLRVLGVSDQLILDGANYVRIQFMATLTASVLQSSISVMQAAGDTVTPMKAQLVSRAIHLALSPLLVFGLGPIPASGLAGAAIANLFAQALGSVYAYWVLFSGRSRIQLFLSGIRLDLPLMWRMTKIGAPASTTNMERAVANLIFVALVSPFGDMALAAYSITQRFQMFVNMGSMGWGIGSGVLVGQNLGAKNPVRAQKTVYWALGYTLIANSIIGGLVLLFPETLLKLFSRDAALLAIAVPWLQIQVLGFMFMGNNMVFQQVYNHAGDTFVPMVVTFGSMWFIEIPLAVMLSGLGDNWSIFGISFSLPAIADLGQYGIAWAIVIALFARLLVYFPYLIWGPWQKRKVI